MEMGGGGGNLSNLDSVSWLDIATIATVGDASSVWSVGAEKNITLSTGETVTLQIYGFNHDDKQSGGKAGITFGCKNLLNTTRSMEATDTNVNGYANSALGQWISNDLFNQLPADLRAVIKTVNKKTSAGNQSTTIVTNALKTFLFSGVEVGGTASSSLGSEGTAYPIFTNDASRIKQRSGTNTVWWLRSPNLTNTTHFWVVGATGNLPHAAASYAFGVSFGFCV